VHLHSYRIANYRRLKDVHVALVSDISIFVGANNSGKTSATQAIHAFVAATAERLSLYDFSADCWKTFEEIGELPSETEDVHPRQ
jgi:predicted ATP-dependent endonuclease of OLD family